MYKNYTKEMASIDESLAREVRDIMQILRGRGMTADEVASAINSTRQSIHSWTKNTHVCPLSSFIALVHLSQDHIDLAFKRVLTRARRLRQVMARGGV